MTRAIISLALICLLTCVNAQADEAADYDQLLTVKRMLTSLGLGDLYAARARKSLSEAVADPASGKDAAWVRGQMTPSETIARMAPIYAQHLSANAARGLTLFFISPTGKKIQTSYSDIIFNGRPFLPPTLTASERQEAGDFFETSSAWRALLAAKDVIADKLDAMTVRWVAQLVQGGDAESARPAGVAVAQARPDALDTAPRENSNSGEAIPGLRAWSQDLRNRDAILVNEFTTRTKLIDLRSILAPQTLISLEQIEAERRNLIDYESALSKYQRQSSQLNDEFMHSLSQLGGPGKTPNEVIGRIEANMANSFERALRSEENQRRILGLCKRILKLAQERFGQISLREEGRLTFADVRDLDLYESLRRQLLAEAKIETDIAREYALLREEASKNLRASAAPVPKAPAAQEQFVWGRDAAEQGKSKTTRTAEPTNQQISDADIKRAQQRIRELESQSERLAASKKQAAMPDRPAASRPGATRQADAARLAALESEIEKERAEYNKRPRARYLGTRVQEYRFASYMAAWRQKVERAAKDNYPEAARGKIYGSVMLSVSINADGSLAKAPEIERSSGQPVLDDAAVNIARLASPYAPFPPDIKSDTDLIVITRVWNFARDDSASIQ